MLSVAKSDEIWSSGAKLCCLRQAEAVQTQHTELMMA